MPTYQYACTNAECGNRFELVQAFTDPAASECPVCSGPVRKVFSAVGVVFKGSGFYRTDSRSNGKPANGKSSTESAPAGKESSSGDSKSESKLSSESKSSSESKPATSGSGAGGKVAASAWRPGPTVRAGDGHSEYKTSSHGSTPTAARPTPSACGS